MTTVLKWILGVLLAGLAWLVAVYTDEYFRPYKRSTTVPRAFGGSPVDKKIRTTIRNK